jgi:hypothetical protein
MPRHAALVAFAVALGSGCSGEGDMPTRAPLGPAEESRLAFQAVDAGTGAALANSEMTVRYLVRSPITLDATAVEQVASTDAYRIVHPVAHDSLVVEVRLEAASYHRLDTVLSVARGREAGPFTLRMTRRLERAAAAGRPASGGGVAAAPADAAAGGGVPGGGGAGAAGSALDRTALNAGNRAFQGGSWLQAIQAYQRMDLPEGVSDADVRAYQQARVRQGVSHLNLGEYAGALDALEEAAGLRLPSGAASLRLAQAQCAVGRVDQGRRTVTEVERMAPRLDAQERAAALAMTQYVTAVCGLGELDRAQTAVDRVRVGGRLVQDFQGFIDRAAGVAPRTEDLDAAVADAQRRIEAIRERMRRGG